MSIKKRESEKSVKGGANSINQYLLLVFVYQVYSN